jgi:hypothetical protein
MMKVFIPREALNNLTVTQLAEKYGGELVDLFNQGGARDSVPYFVFAENDKGSAFMGGLQSWNTGVQCTFQQD